MDRTFHADSAEFKKNSVSVLGSARKYDSPHVPGLRRKDPLYEDDQNAHGHSRSDEEMVKGARTSPLVVREL